MNNEGLGIVEILILAVLVGIAISMGVRVWL